MRAASSAERVIDVPVGIRAAMVALGWIPALHVLLTAAPLAAAIARGDWRWAAVSLGALFLAPPIVVRVLLAFWPLPTGRVDLASGAFLRWWATAQWQVVFARWPWLEEGVRLVPGLYSAWLRLWGARVGPLVYWSPGVVVLDRPLLRVGARVAFGAGVRVNPHVIAPVEDGRGALFVAPIAIGNDVLIGGYSTLLPGCEVHDGEVTQPFRSVHAFSRVERGRRSRAARSPLKVESDVG
jgi:hypothetical protein